MEILGILLGGGVGSLLRYLIMHSFSKYVPENKHVLTFFVNVLGSFALGYLYAYSSGHCSLLYKTIVLGVIASFTTFSTYEFDNLTLLAKQRYGEFFRYGFGSCLVCLLFLYLGIIFANLK